MLSAQVTGRTKSKFMLYPRFCTLIIRHCLPDLPSVQPTLHVNTIGVRGYNACFINDTRRDDALRPTARPLFGYLLDANYVAPANHGWMDDDAASVPAPAPAASVPAPAPAAATVVQTSDPQELIEDVLIQAAQGGHSDTVAQVVHQVLEEHDDTFDALMHDIDQYRPEDDEVPGPSAAAEIPSSDSESESDDDQDPRPPPGMIRYRSQYIMDPAAKGKRKIAEDDSDDELFEVEDEPLQTTRRRIIRARTSQLTIGEVEAPSGLRTESVRPSQAETVPTQSPLPTPAAASPPQPETASLESRVRVLETSNQELTVTASFLASKVLSLTEQLANQGEAYTLLMKTNTNLVADVQYQQRQIYRLDRLVALLLKDKSAQGGEIAVILEESCREDELRRKKNNDKDDDPSASKDSEPTGPSTTGEQATFQGESTKTGGSGAGTSSGGGKQAGTQVLSD